MESSRWRQAMPALQERHTHRQQGDGLGGEIISSLLYSTPKKTLMCSRVARTTPASPRARPLPTSVAPTPFYRNHRAPSPFRKNAVPVHLPPSPFSNSIRSLDLSVAVPLPVSLAPRREIRLLQVPTAPTRAPLRCQIDAAPALLVRRRSIDIPSSRLGVPGESRRSASSCRLRHRPRPRLAKRSPRRAPSWL